MKLPLVVFLLTLGSGLSAQVVWRLSDALGNDNGPAPQTRAGMGWILRVEPRPSGEERVLFHDGVVDSTRLVDFDPVGRVVRWRELRSGQPIWEVTSDPVTGLPRTETSFDANQPFQISTLRFEGRVLVERTVRTAEGKVLYLDHLSHWPDGSLRRLERDGPEGPLAEVSWSYGAGGALAGSWVVDEDAHTRNEHRELTYGAKGTKELLATETKVLLSRATEWLETGETRQTKIDLSTERKEVRLQDAKGRTLEEVVSVKGEPLQTLRWKYDGQGRVVETFVDSAGPQEIWSYRYLDGDLVEGTLTRDGILIREESVRNGEKELVRLYDRGELFLVETWKEGRPTKESYYQKGVVVRERNR